MNRCDFLLVSAAVTALPFAALAAIPAVMPPIEYVWLPPKQDAGDPLGQLGYCGGAIDVRGKRYSVLYSFTEKDLERCGEEELKRQIRSEIDARLRSAFLGAA